VADAIYEMRERLEASRSERDLKRGFGGIADVEFLVQLFQMKYGRERPALRTTNTWEALDALRATDCGLRAADCAATASGLLSTARASIKLAIRPM
jgi:glutamine synthetase adenylyltransferase